MSAFPVELKRMGYLAGGRRRGVDPARHLIRTHGDAPAIDARALAYWKEHDVKVIHVELKDGTKLSIGMSVFERHAQLINRGHGDQWVCQRGHWKEPEARGQMGLWSR